MHNFTGNFILSRMFLNLQKKKKEERQGGGGGGEKEKFFLDNLPGVLGSGRWPGSHSLPFCAIGYSQTTSQWQRSQQEKDRLDGGFSEASLCIFLSPGLPVLDSPFIHGASSLSRLCGQGSPRWVATLTSPRWPLSSSVGSPPSTLQNRKYE